MQKIDTRKRNQHIVEMLEDLLEDAKSGEIIAVAIAGVMTNCKTFNCFEAEAYPIHMLGEIRVLERDIIDLCVDTRVDLLP